MPASRVLKATWLLLGEAPNAATEGLPRLWLRPDDSGIRHSANRLLEFTGYDWETYMRTFTRDNLVHRLPRRLGKGRNFPIATARREVPRVFAEHELCHGFLMLGKRVANAFTWYSMGDVLAPIPRSKIEYLTWNWVVDSQGRRKPAIVIPHPSGLNHWWNDEGNRERAREFFRSLLDGVSFKLERPTVA